MRWSPRRCLRAAAVAAAVSVTVAVSAGWVLSRATASSSRRPAVERWYSIASPPRNEPDPDVVKVGATYVMYFSQTGLLAPEIGVTTSTSLYKWPHPVRPALLHTPAWAIDGFTWAPDVQHLAGRWVMYFDALARPSLYFDRRADNFYGRHAQCIGLATADGPLGPFLSESRPLVCQFADHGSIDPRVFKDADGQLWLDWKSDDNAPAPAASHTTSLWAERLSPNGLSLVGPVHRLIAADEPWESGLIEAPDMVLAAGHYWLFYSGNWYDTSHYDLGLAACKGAGGPCSPVGSAPWSFAHLLGPQPGEASIFKDASGYWLLYSPWNLKYLPSRSRPVAIAHLAFRPSGPYLLPEASRS